MQNKYYYKNSCIELENLERMWFYAIKISEAKMGVNKKCFTLWSGHVSITYQKIIIAERFIKNVSLGDIEKVGTVKSVTISDNNMMTNELYILESKVKATYYCNN
jgi:hypothetical protein